MDIWKSDTMEISTNAFIFKSGDQSMLSWTKNEIFYTKNEQTTLGECFSYKSKMPDLKTVCTYTTCNTNNLQFITKQLLHKVQTSMYLSGWTRHQSISLVRRRYCGALQLQIIKYVVFPLFHSSTWGVGTSGDNFRPHYRRTIVSGCSYDVIRPLHVWGLWTKTIQENCYVFKKMFWIGFSRAVTCCNSRLCNRSAIID